MLRKCICLFWAACLVLVMGIPAMAAEREGTIRVVPVWGGEAVAGGTVTIYRVGTPTEGGFQLTDGLANWLVEEKEVFSRSVVDWILPKVNSEGISVPVQEVSGAEFTGLEEGLYLVKQVETAEGFSAFSPFLVSVPEGDSWEVTARPKAINAGEAPKTGDHPAPIIGAMGLGLSAAILMVLADERKK